MKILVVDDDEMIVHAIAHNLELEGHEILPAYNGLQALELITTKKVDLIISDLMMPDLSGLSLLSILKKFYYNRIPVIVISSLDKSILILSSVGLGAEDFIAKPINFDYLKKKVNKYLH
jgi:DNA-binding response OmpR family regulator